MNIYKLCILIVSSNNLEIYPKMKEISDKYLNLYSHHIKHFYIEYDATMEEEIKEVGNTLYIKGEESIIPGIYNKTMAALSYIKKHYLFEYVMRTNLSTFLHISNIFHYLDTVPRKKFAGGFKCNNFISGISIFISNDVVDILLQNIIIDCPEYDDIIISQILSECGIKIQYIEDFIMKQFITGSPFDPPSIDLSFPKKTLIFRIHNDKDRENDIKYMQYLANEIYGHIWT